MTIFFEGDEFETVEQLTVIGRGEIIDVLAGSTGKVLSVSSDNMVKVVVYGLGEAIINTSKIRLTGHTRQPPAASEAAPTDGGAAGEDIHALHQDYNRQALGLGLPAVNFTDYLLLRLKTAEGARKDLEKDYYEQQTELGALRERVAALEGSVKVAIRDIDAKSPLDALSSLYRLKRESNL